MSIKGFKLKDGTTEKYDYEALDNLPVIPSGSGLSDEAKQALLTLLEKVAYVDENGQTYYDALETALYPPANLVSISAVYTQSGTVYDTDSLDALKTDLVVTARMDDGTTRTVTEYTLIGTLAEGTSTITVSYGGKTTTFGVTVSVFSTEPVITSENTTLTGTGTEYSLTGACVTKAYEYELDIDAFKQTNYYDETNNYSNASGALFKIAFCMPNTNGISFGSRGKNCMYDSSDNFISGSAGSVTRDTSEHVWQDTRYLTGYFTLADNIVKIRFSLATADIDESYAYWKSPQSGVLPVGVNVGDVIFAGKNTQYYNKKNING